MAVMSPLAATLSMGQPIIPASKANIAPTDVLGAYQMSTNQANQQYLAKLQQQNSLWGGLAGLGGSALTAGILKGGLFPGASTAATAAPTALASGSALPDLGSLAFDSAGNATGITGVAPLASALDAGTTGAAAAGVPLAGLDVGATGAADAAGTVGADLAASAAPVAADAAADAGGMTLADLLPFLFAA